MTENTLEKLRILTESAKYDVSCSSSGTVRRGQKGMVGSTVGGVGICHSFADDGRCISLLKVMLTNYCKYDCAYCINRRSNDIKRATLSVSELEEITMEFYRRNYIEGLFLSSGVVRNADYTMERLTAIVRDLRTVHRFNGYIHLKSIPGASQELLNEAGLYADRMSVNIEIPREESLKLLAPEKDHQSVFQPMKLIQQGVLENKEDRRKYRHAPRFVPAGQSTQMIVGATKETDRDILQMSSALYHQPTMRRVYYSGYISVNTYDPRLPNLKQPPLVRENRLYQADWLLRFYHFDVDEITEKENLDLEIDPKLAWALRHPEAFPVDINNDDYERLLRVPGLGTKSAWLIVNSRRFGRLTSYDLKKMGVVMKKAKYFITCGELTDGYSQPIVGINELRPERLRPLLVSKAQQKRAAVGASSGIGLEVARLLAKRGWAVGVAARRLEQLAEFDVAARIDVTDEDAGEHLQQLIGRLGGIDLYFHASGIGKQNRELHEDVELRTMETNAVGFTRMVGTVYRYMAGHGGGHIAVISSIAGTKGLGPAPAYSATKAMQNTYIEALEQLANAQQLNIRFTDIRPGFVDTDLLNDGRRYPLLLDKVKVAKEIADSIDKNRHIRVIDWRWRIVTFAWRLIPRFLWRHFKL